MELHAAVMPVKQEPAVYFLEDDAFGIPGPGGGGGGGGGGGTPKPVEGIREVGPPPFLRKTYDMVDDPNTDPVISWTPTRNSFVVWDPHKLSTDVLPKYFKHNNFSSFIRQLNTYRFRKIDSDRWEFANEGFQKGKKQLLMSIKRRKHHPPHTMLQHQLHHHQTPAAAHKWFGSCDEAEAEICKLRNDRDMMKMEIMRLKQQQESTDSHLAVVKERLETTETRHKYIVLFVVKAFNNPSFVHHFAERMRQRNGGAGVRTSAKRRRLVDAAPEGRMDETAMSTTDRPPAGPQEELVLLPSEIQTLFSSEDSSSPVKEQQQGEKTSVKNNSNNNNPGGGIGSPEMSSENFILWEKLVEDDMIYENETETARQHGEIVHELENLIARPSPEWIRT